MCGVAGYYGTRDVGDAQIAQCLETLRHRGPDAAGHRRFVHNGRTVHLLSTRLTIIDLDARADQPFQLGAKTMSYNGELYNYVELRAALQREGVEFRTSSDTEVLLAAVDHWGWDALDRGEGMWALAVWDDASATLTLSRDRFGEKPLYVYRTSDGIYFGSEVKQIAALLGRWPEVDREHLQRYLVNGYKALYKVESTFFKGVSEIRPGTVVQVDGAGVASSREYWSPRLGPETDMSYDDAVVGVRERLVRSMELRLRADVPVAFCMSGGVDSVSLISIASRVLGYDVHGFTILTGDERYDERAQVEQAVAALGIRHEGVFADREDFLPRLRELVRQHDAPVATSSYYVHWLLMEAIARAGYRVTVSGTAADELFSGYYDHHLAYLADVQGIPGLASRSREAWTKHVQPVVRNPFLSDPDRLVRDPGFRDHIYLNADTYSDNLHSGWSEPFSERRHVPGLLRNRMLNELFEEVVPVILHEDDLNAMAWSIENRSPYLDRDLFEFSTSIPTQHLIRDGRAKAVLRDAMRGIAPDPILDERRKVGFNMPVLDLLDVRDPAVRSELLADSPIFEIVRREAFEALLDQDWLPNSDSKFLFNVVNAKFFLEELEEAPSAARYATPPTAASSKGDR